MSNVLIYPLVSVIMSVYNRQNYLCRAIDSLFKQTYTNWELIAVDDGSTDNSSSLLNDYKTKSEKIKIIYQRHKNLSSARNNGIRNSSGSYLTFLDSDDEYKENHIELRINYMLKKMDLDLLHGGVEVIGSQFVPDKDDKHKQIHLSQCAIGATFFGKRYVFDQLGGFNEDITYSEDSEFLSRAKKVYKVKKVDFSTYIYHRETPDSITNSINKA